jgi:hypothetical protein
VLVLFIPLEHPPLTLSSNDVACQEVTDILLCPVILTPFLALRDLMLSTHEALALCAHIMLWLGPAESGAFLCFPGPCWVLRLTATA